MECATCGHEVQLEMDTDENGLYAYGRCDYCEIAYDCSPDGTVRNATPDPEGPYTYDEWLLRLAVELQAQPSSS